MTGTIAALVRILGTTIVLHSGLAAYTDAPLIAGFEGHGEFTITVDHGPGTPSAATSLVTEPVHSGDSSLRIDHLLPRRGGGYTLLFEDIHPGQLPEQAWALELQVRTSSPQTLNLLFRLDENSGEVWEVTVPFATSEETSEQWRRVTVPFAWFGLVTWTRRDGRLNLDQLDTISVSIRASGDSEQAGTIWLDTFRFIDPYHTVSTDGDAPDGFYPLILDHVFDSDAIAWASNPRDGDFHTGEWEHRTLPAEHFPQTTLADLQGVTFRMPPMDDGLNNHIRSNGQSIAGFPQAGYTAAYFLASGKFGDQTGDAILRYSDGTTHVSALQISDWSMRPQFEEAIGILLPYAYHGNRIDADREPRLFVQSIALDPERELESLRVPINDYLKIFGITLYAGTKPPAIGMMSTAHLSELDPRYYMPDMEEVNFTGPAREAGVLGGYVRHRMGGHVLEIPTLNGFLTYVADARELPHSRLHWHRYQNRNRGYTLGGVQVPSESETPAHVYMEDGTSIVYTTKVHRRKDGAEIEETFTIRHSRAWPAALHAIESEEYRWVDDRRGNNLHLTIPAGDGQHHTFNLSHGTEYPIPAEPWLLVWNSVPEHLHRDSNTEDVRSFGSPMLLVFEKRPAHIVGGGNITFRHDGPAGWIAAMPLLGIQTVPGPETLQWVESGVPEAVISQARTWTRRLQRFPLRLDQQATIDEHAGTVTLRDSFQWLELDSEWGIDPLPFTPFPPTALLAAINGYPVSLPADKFDGQVSTLYGPLYGVEDEATSYTIPISPYALSMLVPGNATGIPLLDQARAELAERIDDMIPANLDTHPYISDVSADVARLRLNAPVRLILGDDPHRDEYSRRVVRNALAPHNLKLEKEPLSNQFFLMDDRFWAKDRPYDKEWSIGFILQGLWSNAYYNDDWAFLRDNWNKVAGLYNYYRIFFDWSTNSTFTMTTGEGANSDGIRIAFDGMLAYARIAAAVGDEDARRDAIIRSARQQMSLYATWHATRWAADHDYLTSANNHVREEDTEMLFSPDILWSEFVTTNAALPERDFFQTTHAFFLFNLAHLMVLADYGIHEKRLRQWLFERIPELHPDWCDGNARISPRGRHYGDSSVMALLIARSLLFSGTLEDCWACLRSSVDDTAVLSEWYGPDSVVPMVLASMITGSAPLVIAPVLVYTVDGNTFDHGENSQRIVLTATHGAESILRIRTGEFVPLEVTIDGEAVTFEHDPPGGELQIVLPAADIGEQRTITVEYEGAE